MIAAVLAVALQAGVPPPPEGGDYFPGPWFIPVQGNADAPTPDFPEIAALVRQATDRLDVAITACVERTVGGRATARDRRLLTAVRRALHRSHVRDVRLARQRCTPPQPPRGVAGVMLTPVAR